MISKFLGKLKSILFKSAVISETPLKKEKKLTKSTKSSKTKTKTKTKAKAKSKSVSSKKNFDSLTSLPGVGAKSAKALYEAGFKTTKAIMAADEKDLLAVSGVGINLVKKLKKLK
nr:helix-hairpin-helix domain-containing protein [Prochlorococcus marinus]